MSITELKEFAKIVERQTECKSNFENLIKKQDDLIKLSNDLIKKLDEEKELHKQIAELNNILDNM
jgi:predicted nuclease with TOPRIM domain